MTALQQEPSARAAWTRTMSGWVLIAGASSLAGFRSCRVIVRAKAAAGYPHHDCTCAPVVRPGRTRSGPGLRLRGRAGPGDQLVELVAARDAELGVGAVQVRGDGARGQEQPVGDLGVGQAAAGEQDDLALLRGEPGQRAGGPRRRRSRDAAGAKL